MDGDILAASACGWGLGEMDENGRWAAKLMDKENSMLVTCEAAWAFMSLLL